jgi:uncharacterized protein YlzI (FlbEa/FlbD family)
MNRKSDEILDILISHVKRKYKDDISLVCCYGSYVNGTAHEMSDVDFYFVPSNERAYKAAMTFIIEGIGYDFWPMTWERLERIARFEDTFVSLLEGSKIVYCSSDEALERYMQLQKQIAAVTDSPINKDMLSKAQLHLDKASKYYFQLSCASDGKHINLNAGGILLEVSDALCLMNNRYFKYGTKKHLEEILGFPYLSKDFQEDYLSITHMRNGPDTIKSCERLIVNAQQLLDRLLKSVTQKQNPSALTGLYEEICSNWNKLYAACEHGDANLAYITGVYLQSCLDEALNSCGSVTIDFLSAYNSHDLSGYKKAAGEAERLFLSFLKSNHIPVNKYETAEEFKAALQC